ncbi:MAG: glycosyltransferase, partial [Candidatus Bathyarchaeia archaeon]
MDFENHGWVRRHPISSFHPFVLEVPLPVKGRTVIMRVCFLNLNLQGGGAERQLVQLARHWPRDNQHHLRVVLLERKGVWLDELPVNVPYHALAPRMPPGSLAKFFWALRLVPQLQKFFRENPCDVALTFLWLPTVVAAIALRRLPNPPLLIWSVQSDLERDFAFHWDGWMRRWLVRTFLPKRVNHFIATSKGVRQKTQTLLGVPGDRFTVIPNSVELAHIREMAAIPDSIPLKKAPVRLISVGRLHPAKGMDVLLHALAKINRQGDGWECYILGDGSERSRLMQLAEASGLNRRLSFVGYKQNPYAWLRTADIFVSPSRWETFGIAIVEAMALGLPVIATATDGANDIISNGVNGLLVPVDDASALADAITNLMHNPSLRQRLGEKAKQKAQQFDAPLIAQRYAELLEQ